jgi:murein DD-endopeptidase MepM/ murein hydrolase activator NlpD
VAWATSLERFANTTVRRLTYRIGSILHHAAAIRPRLPSLSARPTHRPHWDPRVRSIGFRQRATRARLSLGFALPSEAALPIAVSAIVLFASVVSGGPGRTPNAPVGGPTGNGSEPRLAVGGLGAELPELEGTIGQVPPEGADPGPGDDGDPTGEDISHLLAGLGPEARALAEEPVGDAGAAPIIDGPFLEDGTLLKPVAVDTSVADGSGLVRRYRVRAGDTLVGIASRFDVQMMTIWWANRLSSKNDLKVGQVLRIPTVDGLVVTVREGDTLDSIARTNHVKADAIYELNGLTDRTLVMGQTLILPGARGQQIRVPRPTPRSSRPSQPRSSPVRQPPRYSGGSFMWPVSGGDNYISQYFHYGHYGIDIAADYGARVRAAASGTVIFAGWKSNGGGYQVWIAHGSGLYTTYNHMSGVSVGRGQDVGRGDQVGRVGCSGWCTGPHLHFEVWRGAVWDGGHRVNPLIYY